MTVLAMLGILVALFLALPWLAVVFNWYCNVVNRLASRRWAVPDGSVCRAYQPPATAEHCGLCARCGMWDYNHREQRRA